MSTLTIQLPDSFAPQLRECAEGEGITVEQLLASAAAEKLGARLTVEHLREQAVRAKQGFRRIPGRIAGGAPGTRR